jgi:SAM-dependent methyltransferase
VTCLKIGDWQVHVNGTRETLRIPRIDEIGRVTSGVGERETTKGEKAMHAIPQTWHYGLVAEWWSKFNLDGPEGDYFGRFVARGQPALDAGCGTGRLLVPWLKAGFDVDGCDVSTDMIALCRERARREGFEPTLFVQPLHELDPPRTYRTIVACGVFGLGSTRAQDEETLRRFHRSLEPGGTLLLDNEVPYSDAETWQAWTKDERDRLPESWPESGMRKRTGDGTEYELRSRTTTVDPLDQTETREIRAEKWRDGQLIAADEHVISIRSYFRDELLLMLDRAGFTDVIVRGEYTHDEPTADNDFLVFIAKK